MYSDMNGWVVTRPGYKDEPKRVATWYMAPRKTEAIAMATKFEGWDSLYRKGYRCERARIVVSVA
jgi:hypothetical protein